jgi:hypothetical protein
MWPIQLAFRFLISCRIDSPLLPYYKKYFCISLVIGSTDVPYPSTHTHTHTHTHTLFSFSGSAAQRGLWPPHPRGFLITRNDTPQTVGLLWTSDQLVAETSTWQHTTHTTNFHAPGEIRFYDCSRRATVDLRFRPCSHCDRHIYMYVYICICMYISRE